jgi:hypothetical protein
MHAIASDPPKGLLGLQYQAVIGDYRPLSAGDDPDTHTSLELPSNGDFDGPITPKSQNSGGNTVFKPYG